MTNLVHPDKIAGGGLNPSGFVTLRYATEAAIGGNRTITVGCDECFVDIDWDDGIIERRLRGRNFTHTYATAGTYDIKISTIGASAFTPRHTTYPNIENTQRGGAAVSDISVPYARELIGIVDGTYWRCSQNLNYAFMNTSLQFIDVTAKPVFDRATSTGYLFAGTRGGPLTFYANFDLPNSFDANAICMESTSLQTWPASATCAKVGARRQAFYACTSLVQFQPSTFGSLAPPSENPDYYNFFSDGPSNLQLPNGFTMGANGTGPWGWLRGQLWSTLPNITYTANSGGYMWSTYSYMPNITTIPKEALDFRLVTVPLSFNFGSFGGCPKLTTIDFSWCPTLAANTINGWSGNIRNLTLPASMPFLTSWKWDCGESNLSAASIEQILLRVDANNASNDAVVFANPGNPFAPPWNAPAPPTPGDDVRTYTGAAGQSDPIQTWSGAAVTAKNNLVSRGYRVLYYST